MKTKIACMLLGAALCLSACAAHRSDAPGETAKPTQAQTVPPTDMTVPSILPGRTEPVTIPTQTPPTTTVPIQPPTQSPTRPVPTQPVTQPPTQPVVQPTVPPATQPAQPMQPQAVITETVQEIAKLMPELKFNTGLQPGTKVTIPVANNATHTDAVAELHDSLMNLFDYTLYLEQKENPHQVQSVIFDYTYSIRYQGLDPEDNSHVFEVCYVLNKQSFVSDIFNSDEIIRQVTQAVTDSTRVKVTPFEDNQYKKVVVYDYVPFFYTTQQAVDMLTGAVENRIYSENLGITRCTQFRLIFHSKSETAYTFLLYLR